MSENIYPLFFVPVYKDYIWGGDRIRRLFKRAMCPETCAESWEIADRSEGMSMISNGMHSGTSIRKVIESMPEQILGTGRKDQAFPILVKIIDAGQRLSVQVHPDGKTAKALGGEPKNEMWHILDAKAGSKIFAGFNKKIDPQEFEAAIRTNRVEDLLTQIPVSRGDSIYIPAGTVHAIGEGCLILEVQQNSNSTYRAYDWNRVDKNGKSRELHIAEAMKAINWGEDTTGTISKTRPPSSSGDPTEMIITSPFFNVSRINLSTTHHAKKDVSGFHILFIEDGTVILEAGGSVHQVTAGTTCLIPAAIREYNLIPIEGSTSIICVTQPAAAN